MHCAVTMFQEGLGAEDLETRASLALQLQQLLSSHIPGRAVVGTSPHKRVVFYRMNPLALWVALALVVPEQNSQAFT